ncbi:MAG: ATP-binding cassette domain-containing protein [Lachnospiraceae bacterium]|nr:ATP-binding cassette domain-containing protein [Lachnospiraceae bacterium]
MIIIKNLSKSFKKKEILHNVNIELKNGVYGLLGENGAGKTTLMRCIAGLYNDYNGKISKDADIIGYLPQAFDGLGELTVDELLLYFSNMKGLNKKIIASEIDKVLEMVNLADKKKEKMKCLSGGMRRRVGIAQTLLGTPKLIMYDEPTTGLDPKERIRFQNIIAENKGNNNITIISTHIVSDIEYLSDRIIVMKEGKLLGDFSPVELAQQAEGKVYELSENEYELVKSDVMLIKISQDVNERIVRVMSDKEIIGKKVNATVEDGYLWVSR